MTTMEEYPGLVQVKTCDTELGAGPGGPGPGCGMEGGHGSLVTSVANNNNNNNSNDDNNNNNNLDETPIMQRT